MIKDVELEKTYINGGGVRYEEWYRNSRLHRPVYAKSGNKIHHSYYVNGKYLTEYQIKKYRDAEKTEQT